MKMPEGTFVRPLFGSVRFRTTHSTWVRGDSITFLSGFDTRERFGDGLAFVFSLV